MSARRLRVELAPSVWLAVVLIALHAAAAFSLVVVLPGLPGLAAAAMLLGLGLATARSRALLRSAASVRAIELAGPKLEVELESGERFSAELAERRYVSRLLVLLPLRSPVRRTILISSDMAGRNSFRHLRIWALWGKLPV